MKLDSFFGAIKRGQFLFTPHTHTHTPECLRPSRSRSSCSCGAVGERPSPGRRVPVAAARCRGGAHSLPAPPAAAPGGQGERGAIVCVCVCVFLLEGLLSISANNGILAAHKRSTAKDPNLCCFFSIQVELVGKSLCYKHGSSFLLYNTPLAINRQATYIC